jgi:hypothetical protein
MTQKDLNQYRSAVEIAFTQNMLAISRDVSFTQEERAGTALCALASAIGGAAGIWQNANPQLQNAPIEAAIEDMFGVLKDVLAQRGKPKMRLVTARTGKGE